MNGFPIIADKTHYYCTRIPDARVNWYAAIFFSSKAFCYLFCIPQLCTWHGTLVILSSFADSLFSLIIQCLLFCMECIQYMRQLFSLSWSWYLASIHCRFKRPSSILSTIIWSVCLIPEFDSKCKDNCAFVAHQYLCEYIVANLRKSDLNRGLLLFAIAQCSGLFSAQHKHFVTFPSAIWVSFQRENQRYPPGADDK